MSLRIFKDFGNLHNVDMVKAGISYMGITYSVHNTVKQYLIQEEIYLFPIIHLEDLTDWFLCLNYQNILIILNSR